MGLGSSREAYPPQPRRRAHAPRANSPAGKKRRRGLFRRVQPAPPTEAPPITRPHVSRRQIAYGPHPGPTRIPYYVRSRPASLPPRYHRNIPFAYLPAQQPIIVPPRAYPPMFVPQQIPVPPAMIIPQRVGPPPPMMMPQSAGPPPMFMMPQQVSAPPMGQSPWTGYVPPLYNNVPASTPGQAGMTGMPARSYPAATRNLFTDWTGGGIISPGFLGPPI